MTEKQKEGNLLIAEYMGGEKLYTEERLQRENLQQQWVLDMCDGYYPSLTTMEFHNNWKWLMPAWEKFRDTAKVDYARQGLLTNYIADLAQRMAYGGIESFYPKFIAAITWYNENKIKETA